MRERCGLLRRLSVLVCSSLKEYVRLGGRVVAIENQTLTITSAVSRKLCNYAAPWFSF